jgi:tripartite-type tricarboxylate transporter receptor subunit TctC
MQTNLFLEGSAMNAKWIGRAAACGVLTAMTVGVSLAQGYPNRPVRFIIPFATGGGADIIGRTIAQKLSEAFGQQFVVDNRPGAAGNIGTEMVARSPADGYILMLNSSNFATNVSLFSKLNFDPIADFEPISLVAAAPYVLVVHPSLPVTNVKELIALARASPGKLTYGSAGNGTPAHLGMELIKATAKIDMVHVPYKGSIPHLNDLVGGQIGAGFDNVLSSVPLVRAKRLRAIAVSGAARSPALPEVPTVAESGLPGFDVTVWNGVIVPAGTPREIITRLHREIVAALQKPDVRSRMASVGVDIIGSTPQEFAAFMKRDIDKWAAVIKVAGARLD